MGTLAVAHSLTSQDAAHPRRSEQSVEKVWGDSDKPGAAFVIRIHNDARYVVLPHTYPIDENIAVVQGSWSLGTGRRFNRSALAPLELGAYGFVPKKMAHFAWSKTETIIQVHGIGPFSTELVDPAYELTDKGVFLLTAQLQPGASHEPHVAPFQAQLLKMPPCKLYACGPRFDIAIRHLKR